MPDSQEITNDVKSSVRTRRATTYGPEGLTAGPGLNSSDEAIIVEGRADVLNLLQHGITNVVSLDGTSIPKSIIELCKTKKATLFVDGDRGGDMIVKDMLMRTEIAFVAKAPSGKEVEELTGKELHQCLRARKPASKTTRTSTRARQTRSYRRPRTTDRRPRTYDRRTTRAPRTTTRGPRKPSDSDQKFKTMLAELSGTKGAYILNKGMNILGKVPVKELASTIKDLDGVHAVVMDGKVSQGLVKEAEPLGIRYLVGTSKDARSRKVRVLDKSDFK
jgi:DNA primase